MNNFVKSFLLTLGIVLMCGGIAGPELGYEGTWILTLPGTFALIIYGYIVLNNLKDS